MRFLTRALTGTTLLLVTLGLLGLGAWRLYSALDEARGRQGPPPRERAYAVETAPLTAETVNPVITAYGEIRAWRMLELRAASAGPITEISPHLRDGATVAAGELLFRIDPTDYERRVRDAEIARSQAETELAEARQSEAHAIAEAKTARTQLEIKKNDAARKRRLKGQGHIAETALDEARYAVAAAEQALTAKLKAQLAAKVRIQSAELALERAKIALEDTRKALADTRYVAPFSGPLTDVVATLGRRVSNNEKIGVLIDPATLEVSFRVTDAEFGRLLDGGGLRPLPIRVSLDLGTKSIKVAGRLDRTAAVSRLSEGGRMLFAKLSGADRSSLRPGEFVTVEILEEPVQNVAILPARAVTEDGRLFLLTDDSRIEEVKGRIVRRQGQTIIVADVPFGRSYVKSRLPYLGAGVKVKPAGPVPAAEPSGMVALSEKKRAALIAFVKSRGRMPDHIKERLLDGLSKPRVPKRMVESLESRMNGRGRRP